MKLILPMLCLLTGIFIPLQGTINSRLAQWCQHPLQASFLSFLGGTTILFILLLVLKQSPIPHFEQMPPLYLFVGGLLGAFFVTAALFIIPQIGTLTFMTLVLTGQILGSTLIDSIGFLGLTQRAIGMNRVMGLCFLATAIFFLSRDQ